MSEQRELFEKWFAKELVSGEMTKSYCWQAWQAAIASVVVELPAPESATIDNCSVKVYIADYLYDSFNDADIKWTE